MFIYSEDILPQIENDIKQKVIDQHRSFFDSKKESIKLVSYTSDSVLILLADAIIQNYT